ncbi:response regulator transcription factor [Marinomonas mediterranea]|jgi:Response regulator containing a CheY-like receiver domain and an HTH DNA-binding domain|uniref:Response regulator containing a CheY-like receiver domain and an HD-GYP domain n=1 Tax=Marinomonas mediterranea (strain ATCC 700492 / JCM 21426 / NBRC 103028 / MMB-1) TaxID=717774 RepID=F2JW47_MARM1|nr:response regulator transcription factor [Marinomonas mediterranea]ADZ92935.1 response regulator containing a CheY-like receiver domain and an HD-GYP domain [Marinomonas mediterranea MMB-1]WCN10857.1 DNA-binding response regulator [Marinomonas mediterranea]WCN18958.1 DNA-binding response regulator [Marinomonas mediterranea MMB-1]
MLKPKKKVINAYYHPTTAVFLDDHRAFLNSVPLALEDDIAYQAFSTPHNALEYINNHTCHDSLIQKNDFITDGSKAHHYTLNAAIIESKARFNERFAEPSVLITDYALSGYDLNGLEVCESIKHPNVKKVLLTGVADEQIAIEALNNKVIDYYIKKSSPDVFKLVNQLIHQYQQDYIRETTQVIHESLKLSKPLIEDPAIIEYFYSILKQHHTFEYQVLIESTASSLDFLLLDESAQVKRLLVLDPDDLAVHVEVAQDAHADDELLDELRSGNKIPFFPTADGFYHPDIKKEWENYLHPCVEIVGEKATYLAAFIANPDDRFTSIPAAEITSFHDYLQTVGTHV